MHPCRTGMRVLSDLFAKIRDGRGEERDLDYIKKPLDRYSKASMCEIGQSSPRYFSTSLKNFRGCFRSHRERRGGSGPEYSFHSLLTAPCMQACPIHLDIPNT